jgi:hypothetical protein
MNNKGYNNHQKSNIRNISYFLFFAFLLFTSRISLSAQDKYVISHDDSLALENVIVEKYYIADSTDYADTTGGILPKGSITYRIYLDMKPGYYLMSVYGDNKHELFIKTSTSFFNNLYCLAMTGFNVHHKEINENSVALDSWLTLGAASRMHTGILKVDDTDGSILKRVSLLKADGLTIGITPTFKTYNLDMNFFKDKKDASLLTTNNGAWYCVEGVKGPTDDNRVLIAQLTTNGKLSFQLNVQLRTISKAAIKFVFNNPENSGLIPEIQFKGLSY